MLHRFDKNNNHQANAPRLNTQPEHTELTNLYFLTTPFMNVCFKILIHDLTPPENVTILAHIQGPAI